LARSETLAERVRQPLARHENVKEKKTLGGVGFLLNGNLLVGLRKDSMLGRMSVWTRGVVRVRLGQM
jgi:hypothetical protein